MKKIHENVHVFVLSCTFLTQKHKTCMLPGIYCLLLLPLHHNDKGSIRKGFTFVIDFYNLPLISELLSHPLLQIATKRCCNGRSMMP